MKPQLKVEVPAEDQATTSSSEITEEDSGSSTKWSKYSPGAFLEKTATFTAKLAKGTAASITPTTLRSVSRRAAGRTSVEPYRRAAMDAQYRTATMLHETDSKLAPVESLRDEKGTRVIHFNPQGESFADAATETNKVVTSKYNIITFLPIFLFEMFSRVAYLYFLIQAGLSWWSVVSPYSGLGATAALLFVLAVSAVKAIWEDMKRHQEDQRMNTSITHRLNPDGSITDIAWTDVQVGDALVVRDDELFPADLLCLHSALPDNVCFIRTTNLDGETNLKIRKPLDVKGVSLSSMEDVMRLDLTLRSEQPNNNLHKFKGQAVVRNEVYKDMPLSPGSVKMLWSPNPENPLDSPSVEVPVTMNEMLLRGCMLKNSSEIVGLVVYTGKQTRIQMNSSKTPLKVGSFDRFLNFQITLVIFLQLAMCIFCAVANYIWITNTGEDKYFLALTDYTQGRYENAFVQIIINFLTFWILLSYLVPISLFVTLEIVKFWQGFVFLNLDKDMKDPATGEYARCRNSNLNEDLGKVEYIFSDKTGTLTSNEMQLREVSIKGVPYGSLDFRLEEHDELQGYEALSQFDHRMAEAATMVQKTPHWTSLVGSGGSAAKIMAHHTSYPSYGTAGELGLRKLHEELDRTGAIAPPQDAAASRARAAALGHHIVDFFTNICVCHSLILENSTTDTGKAPAYQGPSPDEVALVTAARQMGFEFKSRAQTSLSLTVLGEQVTYEILNVMEYSSERGCMSVIARSPDGTIRLFCKGADTKVMKKIRGDTDPNLLRRTDADLHAFARQGLRTLVLASKVIPEDKYNIWDARYQEASCAFENRDGLMDAVGNEVEKDLELIGVTAIEDKLQDGVPAAIQTLLGANIRIWMITGDKQETAVNIAVSCALISNPDEVMMLNVDEKVENASELVAGMLEDCLQQICLMYRKQTGISVSDPELIPKDWQHGQLAVDGPTLTFILSDKEMSSKLACLSARCSGVVVSRSSPSQKAAIVKMMAEYEMAKAAGTSRGFVKWYKRYRQRLQGKMLSVGDGANDVAMIQTADVGVGIMGKEGRQAVNNSDYAISQFRHLVPLLLTHGNLSYYRLARLIKYSFYKNVTFGMVMFYYQFYNGFSGQALVDSITAAVFNVVFTAAPIGLFALLDRPVKDLKAFVRYPQLYDKRGASSLNTFTFWKTGILLGIVHGAVCFFVPYYSITTTGEHNITDVYSIGKVTFAALLGAVTLEIALVTRYWTWVLAVATFLSYFLVYPYMVIFPLLELAVGYYDPANVGVTEQVLASPTFWFVIIICYIITFGMRYAERTALWVFRPHDSMILAEKERREGNLLGEMSGKTQKRLLEMGLMPKSRKTSPDVEAGNGHTAGSSSSGQGSSQDAESVAATASGDSVKAWETLQPGTRRRVKFEGMQEIKE